MCTIVSAESRLRRWTTRCNTETPCMFEYNVILVRVQRLVQLLCCLSFVVIVLLPDNAVDETLKFGKRRKRDNQQ